MKKVYFFIPVYFDAASVILLRKKLTEEFIQNSRLSALQPHFYLLDDSAGADSDLLELTKESDVSILPMPFNLGHQRALVYGLRTFFKSNLSEDFAVVTMDADGEDRPEDLIKLFEKYQSEKLYSPFVLAKRTKRKESLFFKIFYSLYKKLFWFLTGTVIQSGNFAFMHGKDLRKVIYHPFFDLSYASTLISLSSKIRFVPCPRGERYEGKSKMGFTRLAVHGIRMLMPFMDKIAVRGVIFFSFFAFLSFIGVVYSVFSYFQIGAEASWIMIIAVSLFLVSLLSISNFFILITIFSNIQALALSRLESGIREASIE